MDLEPLVAAHRAQLQSSWVPEIFWSTIFHKLENEIYDAGDFFKIVRIEYEGSDRTGWKVVLNASGGIKATDPSSIYIVDHAWTYDSSVARQNLTDVPGLLQRMLALMDISTGDAMYTSDQIDAVLKEQWRFTQTYSFGNAERGTDEALPLWYILDEFGSKIQHSDEPTFRMVPFFYLPKKLAFSLLWPLKDVEEGAEVCRDYVESSKDELERQARLIPWIPCDFTEVSNDQEEPDADYFEKYRQKELLPTADEVCSKAASFTTPGQPGSKPVKVFTTDALVTQNLTDARYALTQTEEDADIIWTTKHIKDFRKHWNKGQFVNQFPFEMVVTVKSLLAVVSRRAAKPGHAYPRWLPVTYNLTTELSQFVSCFQQRANRGEDNHWICKPWNLGRTLDMHVTQDLSQIIRLRETGPKIASKYIDDPVLFDRPGVGKVKFDFRYMVLLHSVQPLRMSVYKVFWLRFANNKFVLRDLDQYDTHFTVHNYCNPSKLFQLGHEEFVPLFNEQYPEFPWESIQQNVLECLTELFEAATAKAPPRGFGQLPNSRAQYGIDLMLTWATSDTGRRYMQPMVLEVNFYPDCTRACKYHPTYFNDVFNSLFFDEDLNDRVLPVN